MLDVLQWSQQKGQQAALVERGVVMDYAHLADHVHTKMDQLARLGFGPGCRLAITPSLDTASVTTMLAATELGVTLVPLHGALPENERRRRAADIGATFLDQAAETPPALFPNDTSLFAILHTSGTSGAPKRVRISRRALSAAMAASAKRLGWRDHDRWALFLPPAHIGGLSVLFRALTAGHTVVLGESSAALPLTVAQHRVTMVSLVPTQLHRLVEAGYRFPSTMRVVLVGGAPLDESLRQRAESLGYPIFPTYGMTETCAQIATARPGEAGVGRLLEGAECSIRSSKLRTSKLRSSEQGGEIWLRGPMLMDGYEGEPSPFDAEGFFRTGDLGYLDDKGCLHVTGRATDRIISGGENVDPKAVESALLEIEGVKEACVFPLPDPEWGQVVAAALVTTGAADKAVTERAGQLPVPSHARPKVVLVLDELPRNAMGKVDRRRLAKECPT